MRQTITTVIIKLKQQNIHNTPRACTPKYSVIQFISSRIRPVFKQFFDNCRNFGQGNIYFFVEILKSVNVCGWCWGSHCILNWKVLASAACFTSLFLLSKVVWKVVVYKSRCSQRDKFGSALLIVTFSPT